MDTLTVQSDSLIIKFKHQLEQLQQFDSIIGHAGYACATIKVTIKPINKQGDNVHHSIHRHMLQYYISTIVIAGGIPLRSSDSQKSLVKQQGPYELEDVISWFELEEQLSKDNSTILETTFSDPHRIYSIEEMLFNGN